MRKAEDEKNKDCVEHGRMYMVTGQLGYFLGLGIQYHVAAAGEDLTPASPLRSVA